jgi:hypothetical protein
LFCHANRAELVRGTVNSYRPTIMSNGPAIGCERCHGPGALHIDRPASGDDGLSPTIVNPRDLQPSLREAVCEQCHLKGRVRVERIGRRAADYRPGLPLDEFMSVFVEPEATSGDGRSVGQVEQMHASRCYRASRGQLGCISCHDPHRLPSPSERVAFYRGRCLACHKGGPGCSLPEETRRAQDAEDSCIRCHMPRSPLADIAHIAETDHRILRQAGERSTAPGALPPPAPDRLPLVSFHGEPIDAHGRIDAERDLGVALSVAGEELRGPAGARLCELAVARLESALQARPDDLAAREALGAALAVLGRSGESLTAMEAVLAREPGQERALDVATLMAARVGRFDDALAFARRALAVDPSTSAHHVALAQLSAQRRAWQEAVDACRAALRLNPADLSARRLLVLSLAQSGDRTAARAEREIYLRFDPPDRDRFMPNLRDPNR